MAGLVTVVIPAHNRANVLPRAVQSVMAQTHEELELIVVDDGSTDDTVAVLEGLRDPRLRVITQTNAGPSGARNVGASRGSGELITFLDSDDVALPGWIGRLNGLFDRREVAVTSCGAHHQLADGGDYTRLPEELGPIFEDQIGLFLSGTYMVRREAFEAVGGFAEDLRCGEHSELAMRLVPHVIATGQSLRACREALVIRRVDRQRLRLKHYRENRYGGTRYILEHHAVRLAKSPRRLANYYSNCGVSAAGLGHLIEARRMLRRAIGTAPTQWKNYVRLVATFVPPVVRRMW